jgi:hypothetical protein
LTRRRDLRDNQSMKKQLFYDTIDLTLFIAFLTSVIFYVWR